MMRLGLDGGPSGDLNILCLGCHSDDIEIGCGGAVLRLARQYPRAAFHWVVFGASGVRAAEAGRAAQLFVDSAQLRGPVLHSFPNSFMPYAGAEIKGVFEQMKATIAPDLIFTHYGKDAHQDHRLISELTWNTFRDHFILEYEIPKYDGDMGQPNVFIPLQEEVYRTKVRHLMEAFPSQHSRQWFREDTFLALMRLRGMECNAPSGYAEAFYCRKLTL